LRSNQVSFKKFDVQCGDLFEKAHKCHEVVVEENPKVRNVADLFEKAHECHEVLVEENPKVRSVDIFPKSKPTGVKEITRVQMDACPFLRWESLNSKEVTLNT